MSKITLMFVPGAWHGPEIYDATKTILEAAGYPTVVLPLPSVGANPPHTNFDGDVKAIRDCLVQLIEVENRDVILIVHSYTGMPAGEAPVGLSKSERRKKNLDGGLVRLVFIMSYIVPEGFQSASPSSQFPAWMKLHLEEGITTVSPEDAEQVFYNDLPPKEASKWAAALRPQSLGVFTSKTTYAAWRYVPSTFVIGTEDWTTFTKELVDSMIENARKQVPSATVSVETCIGGGHCLMLGHPDWLASVIRRAAGEAM